MFWNDHAPPHFHALYAEHEVLIDIRTLDILEGEMPGGRSGENKNAGLSAGVFVDLETKYLKDKLEGEYKIL